MSCDDNTCGTGLAGETIPKPGDPDNSIALSAHQVYGGITVTWTWPTINPGAVSHTVVYRGTTNVWSAATEIGRAGGNSFYDVLRPTSDTTYYYWIRVRSTNGTLADQVGPASAIAKAFGPQIVDQIAGLLDMDTLEEILKTSIAGIAPLRTDLIQETADRIAGNEYLSGLIDLAQSDMDLVTTLVQQEITQRVSGDSALVTQINNLAAISATNLAAVQSQVTALATSDAAQATQISTLFTRVGTNEAAIASETTARSTADSAIASNVTTLFATTAGHTTDIANNAAAISNEATVRAAGDATNASAITTLTTRMGDAETAIITETSARTSADSAHASQISSLDSRVTSTEGRLTTSEAAIVTEQSTRASADASLASSISSTEASLNGNIATVQTGLQSQINSTNGTVSAISAGYFAKVQVNGLIGGFGLYNTGSLVEAGFDVDKFWIGRDGAGTVHPFMVSGGVVYIDKVRIKDADIDTLKIAGHAVTNLNWAYTEARDTTLESTLGGTVQTLTMACTGSPVRIDFVWGETVYSNVITIVYRDGVEIHRAIRTVGSFIDTPSAGNRTYTITWDKNGGGMPLFVSSKRFLSCIEVKR